MLRSAWIILGAACLFAGAAQAARAISVAIVPHPSTGDFGNGDYVQLYCNVFNPSSVIQTLTATWHVTGGLVSWNATNTTTTTTPTPVRHSRQRALALVCRGDGNPGSYAPQNFPRAVTFTVNEDDGYLVGNCVIHFRSGNASGSVGHNTIAVNGGRPF